MLRDFFVNFSVLGTLTQGGIYLVILRPRHVSPWVRRAAICCFLAASSILLVAFPIRLSTGVIIDFRAVPILLAAMYGGPVWGLAAALPVAVYRYNIGGAGMVAGLISIFGTPLVSMIVRRRRLTYDASVATVARHAAITFSVILLDLLLIRGQVRYFFWGWYPVLVLSYTAAVALCVQLLRVQYLAHSHLRETEEHALTDHLTGLPNLRAFETDLRGTAEGCLLLIDVDHFKWVNDSYGHPTGNLILQHIAATLQRSVRAGDLVFRHGGEEFAVLLRPCSPEEAGVIAERVRANVAVQALTLPNGETLRVTVSGGLCPVVPGPLSEQIAIADQLLYRAKAAGRNRICSIGGHSRSSTGTSSKEPTTSTSTAPTTAATPSQIQ